MDCVDVNKLKQDILDSWNNDTHRGYAASRIHWQEHQELMLIVARQPTVDVVPRAEFEQLQHKYALAVAEREANVKGFTEELARAKTEAAKEIFSEIEKVNNRIYNSYVFESNDYSDDDVAIECAVNYGTEVAINMDVLKKKYTEGEQ